MSVMKDTYEELDESQASGARHFIWLLEEDEAGESQVQGQASK